MAKSKKVKNTKAKAVPTAERILGTLLGGTAYDWTGAISGDVGVAGNYNVHSTGSASTVVPGQRDQVSITSTPTNTPSSGISYADWIDVVSEIDGGTYYGYMDCNGLLAGGTFYGFTVVRDATGGGTYYGTVSTVYGEAVEISGGTFNGILILASDASCVSGTANGLIINPGNISTSRMTVNGPVVTTSLGPYPLATGQDTSYQFLPDTYIVTAALGPYSVSANALGPYSVSKGYIGPYALTRDHVGPWSVQ